MFCQQCGTQIEDGLAFCTSCGAKQVAASTTSDVAANNGGQAQNTVNNKDNKSCKRDQAHKHIIPSLTCIM